MIVRALDARDADAMARIHATSFDKGWSPLDMAVHVSRDLCLGTGDPLGGFAILRRSDIDAEILTVATDPDCRRRGYAGALLEAAREQLKRDSFRHIFLEVAEDNGAARALYERLGYQPIGRRPAYYARPDGRVAAITYALDFSGNRPTHPPAMLDEAPTAR